MTPESSSRHDKGCSNERLNILMLDGDSQRGYTVFCLEHCLSVLISIYKEI